METDGQEPRYGGRGSYLTAFLVESGARLNRVVLRGGLSNHPNSLQDLLQCLMGPESDQGRRRRPRKRSGWPDGRRRFGTVSGAVLKVLERSGGEMSTKAIREEVEALLGENVSRFTVSDFLLARSKGAKPLFERTRYGHYRLR